MKRYWLYGALAAAAALALVLMAPGAANAAPPAPNCELSRDMLEVAIATNAGAVATVYEVADTQAIIKAYNDLNPRGAIDGSTVETLVAVKWAPRDTSYLIALFDKAGCLLFKATIPISVFDSWRTKANVAALKTPTRLIKSQVSGMPQESSI